MVILVNTSLNLFKFSHFLDLKKKVKHYKALYLFDIGN